MVFMLDRERVGVTVYVVLRQPLDPDLGSKPGASALPKVHVRASRVCAAVPWVPYGIRVEVDFDVSHLVDPACEVTVRVAIAAARGAAKRDAEYVACPNLVRGGHSRDPH